MKQKHTEKNDQLLVEIQQLFESKNTKHKQDRDFLKGFQQVFKKDSKIQEKKQIVNEIFAQFKIACQNKYLYFNTIVDGLLLLQQKDIFVGPALQEAIQTTCQIDKKSKDIQDFEGIKIFCFQKLDISTAQDYQINEQQKILVFMERVIKHLQNNRSKEEFKKIIVFLQSISFVNQQLQVQALICIIIQRIIINLTKEHLSLKYELKLLFSILDDQTIHVALIGLISIAKTSIQHEFYHYIFKACTLIIFQLFIKSKTTLQIQQLIISQKNMNYFIKMQSVIKDFNQQLYFEHKDQSILFEKPRLVIDYLPTNLLLDVLLYNPQNFLIIQNFLQEHVKITDQYLNFTLANLAQRQCKINSFHSLIKLNVVKDKTKQISDWLTKNIQIITQSQQLENGDYNSYLFCQLHLLIFLQSINAIQNYFQCSNIKTESKFFKMLVILKLEQYIFKYQEQSQLIKVRHGINSYNSKQITKQLFKLIRNPNIDNIQLAYQDIKLIITAHFQYQGPFLSKLPSFIQVMVKDLYKQSTNNQLYLYYQQIYLNSIIILSIYSKQGFHSFIFELLNCSIQNKIQNPCITQLNNFQMSALEEIGVIFDNLQLQEAPIQNMIKIVLQFFLTFEITAAEHQEKLTWALEKIKQQFIKKIGSLDKIQMVYRNLMVMALDRCLMQNGLHSFSFLNRKSKFQDFFNVHLKDNKFFLDCMIIICSNLKQSEITQNLQCLGTLYFQSILLKEDNQLDRFKICCYTLFCSQAKVLIEFAQQLPDPNRFYSLLYKNIFEGQHSTRKQLIRYFLDQSRITRIYYNELLKIIQ